ncbi:hypothetical protein CJP72_21500 [Citrobacter sp. NCU1]|uniref:hypothetical protein n=1 Tax=Citrobacter sp. NCU1 TaxID=2026683 RepID=UPI001391146F|nr:hypothetical protein [Citrobacter sp. NCU1]NDO83246.1 hypothetical protein [Citrobacter sp. NCU1]
MIIYTGVEWIEIIFLGGLSGALGQGARCIVGLKKLGKQAMSEGRPRTDLFDMARLLTSFLIGFIAGSFTAILASPELDKIQIEQLLAFASAGYAGTDAIEAFISHIEPNNSENITSTNKDYLG